MRITACILAHQRPGPLAECVASLLPLGPEGAADELVVLDNGSRPALTPMPGVTRWERSASNLGVPGGRNRLAALAGPADVLVFIDDDAVLRTPLRPAVEAAFAADPSAAVLAFAVVRPDGTIASAEWPFRGPPPAGSTPPLGAARPCGYFVGAGYAVRRAALDAVGGYDAALGYSTEEIDLAMRLAAAGWSCRFEPDLVVEHRPAAAGRLADPQVPALRWRNRLVYVRRHLPWPVATVHAAAWGVRTAREAQRAGDLRPWLRAGWEGLRTPVRRRPLRWNRLRDVHAAGGRVWW